MQTNLFSFSLCECPNPSRLKADGVFPIVLDVSMAKGLAYIMSFQYTAPYTDKILILLRSVLTISEA